MPELPEVETVRRGLANLIVGSTIAGVVHDNPKSFPNDPQLVATFVVGAQIVEVRRRAKILMIDLSSDYTLVTHLKMTGQLVYRGDESFGAGHPNDSLVKNLPDRSTRVKLDFTDGSKLFFNDQRKFGWMKLYPTIEVPEIDFMRRVGPEPLEPGTTPESVVARFRRRNRSVVKAVLLDQTVIAGVGNIYADEGLWVAQIHPSSRVQSLSDDQIKRLFVAIVTVLQLSIDSGGSTDRNYVDAEGKKGNYLRFAKVFRRQGQACDRCGEEIIKIRVAGRGTHLCPRCQAEVVAG